MMTMLANVQQKTIRPIIDRCVEAGSLIYTDEYDIYARLTQWGYAHETVCHAKGEYARDDDADGFCEVHVNTMEGVWSLLRSWLRPHRGISQEKLPIYVGFFQFVHNARKRGQSLLGGLVATLLPDAKTITPVIHNEPSPFTAGHSRRVALFADMIGEELGRSEAQRRFLKRTALLHDIGKLGVSNQILDKPGKPDDEEWAAIRRHPALSEAILFKIGAFRDLSRIAGAHHERLDGKGYPRGLHGAEICEETRILTAADIFDALTADRPYRAAMSVSRALSIMLADLGTAIDSRCFHALARAMQKLEQAAA